MAATDRDRNAGAIGGRGGTGGDGRDGGERALGPAVRVRTALPSDGAVLAGLAAQLGYPTDPAEMDRRFRALPDGDSVFVAVIDGEVVGWVHCSVVTSLVVEPHVQVLGLVVDERCRGRGIGRRLMHAADGYARERGRAAIRLRSGAERAEAHRFYESIGFRLVKTHLTLERRADRDGRS